MHTSKRRVLGDPTAERFHAFRPQTMYSTGIGPKRRMKGFGRNGGCEHDATHNCMDIQYMAMRSRRTAPVQNRFSSEEKRRESRRGRHVTPRRSKRGRIVSPGRACTPTRRRTGTMQHPAPRRAGPPAARQPSSNASSSSCSWRTFSNICSRSGTSSPRRASPDTSSTTCPWCSITVRSP
jgi:hypothetical protein